MSHYIEQAMAYLNQREHFDAVNSEPELEYCAACCDSEQDVNIIKLKTANLNYCEQCLMYDRETLHDKANHLIKYLNAPVLMKTQIIKELMQWQIRIQSKK